MSLAMQQKEYISMLSHCSVQANSEVTTDTLERGLVSVPWRALQHSAVADAWLIFFLLGSKQHLLVCLSNHSNN